MNGHQLALDGAIIHRGYLFAFEISNMARASHSISIEAATGIVSSVYIRRESIFNALCVHIIYECKCEEEASLCEAGTLKQNVPRLSDDPLKILPPRAVSGARGEYGSRSGTVRIFSVVFARPMSPR